MKIHQEGKTIYCVQSFFTVEERRGQKNGKKDKKNK